MDLTSHPAQTPEEIQRMLHELRVHQIELEMQNEELRTAQEQTIAPRALDVDGVVAGMVKMMRHLVGEEISLDWRPCKNLWPVKIDPTQLNQILANLGVNSRDVIAGRGRITIATEMVTMAEAGFVGNIGFIPAGQAVKRQRYPERIDLTGPRPSPG